MSVVAGSFVTSESGQQDADALLMLQVREDNAEAFEELVLRYQGRLLAVMGHLVGARDSAEDLVQEVFLRVYRARKNYEVKAKFSTWIYTIAHNVASNALRARKRRKEINLVGRDNGSTGVQSLDTLAQAASGQMPTRQLEKAEMLQVVRMSLDALNDRQRMAVLLNKFEHMSYADIGKTMELSPQAVKSLLARARSALREVLEPYLNEGTFNNR